MSTYLIKCDICEKDIITQHCNTKYCPDCKKNIIRIRNSNARISAIAAEARKAGLTYGKYVASLREVTQ